MTETQTPNPDCPKCAGSGSIPPFMDDCSCLTDYSANAAVTVEPGPMVHGEMSITSHSLTGETSVWTGAAWVPVKTEALTPAEYYAKYHPEPAEYYAKYHPEPSDDDPVGGDLGLVAEDYASGYGEAGIYSDPSTSYGSPKPKVTPKPMTASQGALLTRLTAERDAANPVVAHAAAKHTGPLSAGEASKLIDALLKVPANPALKPTRANSYDGTCRHCGGTVLAGAGVIDKIDGRWKTGHKPGECLTTEAKATLEADKVTEPGLYKYAIDGVPVVFRVRKSRASHRLYAERVCIHEHDGEKTVAFAYNGKAMAWLRASAKLTWLEARDFGAAYGACVACGRTLSDPRSLVQQYGSTCAGHYGWPTVTKKQAEAIIEGVLTWDEAIAGLGVLTS